MSYSELGVGPRSKKYDVRCCAFRSSYVNVSEITPTFCLLTHDLEAFRCMEQYLLAKVAVGVELSSGTVWGSYDYTSECETENVPGGLRQVCQIAGTPFMVEVRPLFYNGNREDARGGMILRFQCEKPLRVKISAGELICLMASLDPSGYTDNTPRHDPEDLENSVATQAGKGVYLENEKNPYTIFVYGAEAQGKHALLTLNGGTNYVCVTFAHHADQIEITDFEAEFKREKEYFETLLNNFKVETPNADINDTFGYAIDTLEQCWSPPFGWTESMHHWPNIWHQEHTLGEDWVGHADRARSVLTMQLKNMVGGEIPALSAGGVIMQHWGGETPYTFRSVEHYLKMTGDTEFAKWAMPYLERAVEQLLKRYDPTDTGVPGFGCQIANQEDFEAHVGPGAATGAECAHILSIMANVCRISGNGERAEYYSERAERTKRATHERFWMPEVGRYAWYEDLLGNKRLDPSYHALCYPFLYGQTGDVEAVSSVDHMMNRLKGPDGEIYQSNHFGGHVYNDVATWGMQAGANNQAVPAIVLSKLGRHRDAVRPLAYVAGSTCNIHRGCIPETNAEGLKTYFSPTAGLYVQAVVEGLFGIERDVLCGPNGRTVIAPCLPMEWKKAAVSVLGAQLTVRQDQGVYRLSGTVQDTTDKVFVLRLPPCREIEGRVHGRKAEVRVKHRLGFFELELDLGNGTEIDAEISAKPIELGLTEPPCTAEGESFTVASKCRIVAFGDYCGITDRIRISDTAQGSVVKATLKKDLMTPYRKFGWFGLINFARRMMTVTLCDGETEFDMPVFITVLPSCALHADYENGAITVQVLQNGAQTANTCTLLLNKNTAPIRADIQVEYPGRLSKGTAVFQLDQTARRALTPGRNTAEVLVGDQRLEINFICNESAPLQHVPLEEAKLCPPDEWQYFGKNTAPESTIYWMTPANILCDVFQQYQTVERGALSFAIAPKGFLPVSSKPIHGKTPLVQTVSLEGRKARKVYLLLSCFITSQHAFSAPFTVEVEAACTQEYVKTSVLSEPAVVKVLKTMRTREYFAPVFKRELNFPGDLDIGLSGRGMYGLPSYVDEDHCKRHVLPPQPDDNALDYPAACPPEYPQHYLWNEREAFEVNETVFSIVEIPLDCERELKEVRVKVNDAMAALGIYAVTLA